MTEFVAAGVAFMLVGFATIILSIFAHAAVRKSRHKFVLSIIGATGGVQVIVGSVIWGIVILNEVAAYYANH